MCHNMLAAVWGVRRREVSEGLMQWSRGKAGARGRGAQTWGMLVAGGCGVW